MKEKNLLSNKIYENSLSSNASVRRDHSLIPLSKDSTRKQHSKYEDINFSNKVTGNNKKESLLRKKYRQKSLESKPNHNQYINAFYDFHDND